MDNPGARPWWADVQHLRPAADREREEWSRGTRDAALEDVREAAGAASGEHATARPRSRFGRATEALGSVATLERFPREDPQAAEQAAAGSDQTFDDELASWLDEAPATRARAIELVIEEPLPVEDPAPRRERFTTDDWLALTAPAEVPPPDEHRDPATGRRTIEIRGQAAGVRGVARPDDHARATGGPTTARAAGRARAPRTSVERLYGRPDRVAMWAFVLGIVLILVALIGTPEAGAATRLGDRTLKTGMEGRDVRHLQLRLRTAGFFSAPATARFGSITKRALKRYQRSRCLTADGIAGPATIRALRSGRRSCRGGSSRRSAKRSAYRSVDLGARTLARGMRGNDVRTLQRLLGLNSDGIFGTQTKRAVKSFQRGAGIGVDGAVGPATRAALARRRMSTRVATWYGPGLYGNRTACGQKLTRRLQGVAHKKLACGSTVLLAYGGRFVTARVVDRGPYAHGATFDLTAATARRIGLRSTDRLSARY